MVKSRLVQWNLQGSKGRFIFFICCMFILFVCSSVMAFKLPDTGQTTCYDQVGNVISCPAPGEPLAQDGSYSINPLSYTDNDNGTVTDNNTGLVWQQEDDGKTYNWYQASGTYNATYNPTLQDVCGTLNLGGHSDWRLPAKKELMSIVDYGIPYSGPTIDTTYFPNTKSDYYWSSTAYAREPYLAWTVLFYYGGVYPSDKNSYGFYVRCVRGGPQQQSFVDNGNGTVTDSETGLMWQQGEAAYMTWGSALSYCEGLSLAENSDWRLPNIKELESLTDDTRHDPAIDPAYFPNAYASNYWSSTSNASNPYRAWGVYFSSDGVGVFDKDYGYYYIRCMRGGQSGPLGPSQLRSKAVSSTQIVLSWVDNSGDETGFKIERKIGSCCSANSWEQIATKGANVTTHTNKGLSPNSTYSYRVRAYNANGDSDYSNCVSAKAALSGTPKAPTNLNATSISTSQIKLIWTDNSIDETSFKIYRKKGSEPWSLLIAKDKDAVSHFDITAFENTTTTTYSYYVRACNSSGCSPKTNAAIVPYKPINLTAIAVSSTGIDLTWIDTSSNETGFQIYRKLGTCSSTSSWGKINTTGSNITSYSNTGLTSGTTYSYKVRAHKRSSAMPYAYGYSSYSNCKKCNYAVNYGIQESVLNLQRLIE